VRALAATQLRDELTRQQRLTLALVGDTEAAGTGADGTSIDRAGRALCGTIDDVVGQHAEGRQRATARAGRSAHALAQLEPSVSSCGHGRHAHSVVGRSAHYSRRRLVCLE
jgi:hypothetical protein